MSSERRPAAESTFDYIKVDPAARRVYLSHGTEVLVVNADTGALEGKISGLQLEPWRGQSFPISIAVS